MTSVFIEAEHTEIALVRLHDIAQESAKRAHVFDLHHAGLLQVDGILAKIRQPQIPFEFAAVCVRIGAHMAIAGRRNRLQFGAQLSFLVK
jgi:hypothetical protein